jgi:drug/metabolite transporter (DMT)-like permease
LSYIFPKRGDDHQASLPFVHLLMIVSATLVSTSFTVGAAITSYLDPAILTLVRFMLAVALFGPWVKLKFGWNWSWSLLLRTSLISACLVGFFYCMFLALRYTTPLHTSVLFALVPSMSAIYSLILFRQRLVREQLLALICGLIGVIWVIFKGDLSLLLSLAWNKGDLIFLGGCFAMGLYTPLIKLLHRGESMAVMTFWVLVTGSFWLLLLAGTELRAVAWQLVPVQVWLGIGYLAVFTTIITFFLTQYSVPHLGPTRVMAYSYLYPALVLVIEFLLGHGGPPLRVLPGVLVILAAMFILQRGNRSV